MIFHLLVSKRITIVESIRYKKADLSPDTKIKQSIDKNNSRAQITTIFDLEYIWTASPKKRGNNLDRKLPKTNSSPNKPFNLWLLYVYPIKFLPLKNCNQASIETNNNAENNDQKKYFNIFSSLSIILNTANEKTPNLK